MIHAFIIVILVAILAWALQTCIEKFKKGGGCCPEHEETVKRTVVRDRNKSHYPWKITLQIGGMTCDNCARKVENALNKLDGVWAKVSISDQKATVLCKTQPDAQLLSRTVQQAGYAVTGCSEIEYSLKRPGR